MGSRGLSLYQPAGPGLRIGQREGGPGEGDSPPPSGVRLGEFERTENVLEVASGGYHGSPARTLTESDIVVPFRIAPVGDVTCEVRLFDQSGTALSGVAVNVICANVHWHK